MINTWDLIMMTEIELTANGITQGASFWAFIGVLFTYCLVAVGLIFLFFNIKEKIENYIIVEVGKGIKQHEENRKNCKEVKK